MDNFLRRSNVEIQGVPVVNNENLESLVMSTLKVVDPRIQRKDVVSFKRMKPTGTAEDNKKVNPILVKLALFEQKVKIMKEKKSWQMLILTLYAKILRRCTSTRTCHHLAGTFFTIQEGSKRLMAGSSLGRLVGLY